MTILWLYRECVNPITRSLQPYLYMTDPSQASLCSMTLGRCRPSVQSIRCFPAPPSTLAKRRFACPRLHGRPETSKMSLFTPRAKSLLSAPVLENKIKKASGRGYGSTAQEKITEDGSGPMIRLVPLYSESAGYAVHYFCWRYSQEAVRQYLG